MGGNTSSHLPPDDDEDKVTFISGIRLSDRVIKRMKQTHKIATPSSPHSPEASPPSSVKRQIPAEEFQKTPIDPLLPHPPPTKLPPPVNFYSFPPPADLKTSAPHDQSQTTKLTEEVVSSSPSLLPSLPQEMTSVPAVEPKAPLEASSPPGHSPEKSPPPQSSHPTPLIDRQSPPLNVELQTLPIQPVVASPPPLVEPVVNAPLTNLESKTPSPAEPVLSCPPPSVEPVVNTPLPNVESQTPPPAEPVLSSPPPSVDPVVNTPLPNVESKTPSPAEPPVTSPPPSVEPVVSAPLPNVESQTPPPAEPVLSCPPPLNPSTQPEHPPLFTELETTLLPNTSTPSPPHPPSSPVQVDPPLDLEAPSPQLELQPPSLVESDSLTLSSSPKSPELDKSPLVPHVELQELETTPSIPEETLTTIPDLPTEPLQLAPLQPSELANASLVPPPAADVVCVPHPASPELCVDEFKPSCRLVTPSPEPRAAPPTTAEEPGAPCPSLAVSPVVSPSVDASPATEPPIVIPTPAPVIEEKGLAHTSVPPPASVPPDVFEQELRQQIREEMLRSLEEEISQRKQELQRQLEEMRVQAQTAAKAAVQDQVEQQVKRKAEEEKSIFSKTLSESVFAEPTETVVAKLKIQQYWLEQKARKLEERELELKKRNDLYAQHLSKLEAKCADFYKVAAENFQKGKEETQRRFARYDSQPVCGDLQNQVLKCYLENPGKSLSCSRIASAYMQCVDNAKKIN
ncbi:uncharacterized protein LOC128771163 [Synchiropus splendidus]|uniref:uncharacterized protein LOC128771163 n=1 Tax=Synchiropus splendidus TaxID=270530 RepID=UPI00237E39E7|nr:uncharacterized protein LOC128771163 [Synchiropus splendidus]